MTTRHKRRICAIISACGLLFAIATAGGMSNFMIGLGPGCTYMAAGIAVFGAAAWKGGYLI